MICDLRSKVEPMCRLTSLWAVLTHEKNTLMKDCSKVFKAIFFLFYPTMKDVVYVYSAINTKIISHFSVKNDRLGGINTSSQNVVSLIRWQLPTRAEVKYTAWSSVSECTLRYVQFNHGHLNAHISIEMSVVQFVQDPLARNWNWASWRCISEGYYILGRCGLGRFSSLLF